MGLVQHIKNWFAKPLTPNASPVDLGLYILLVVILLWLVNSTVLAVGRIGKAIVE